MQYKKSVLSNHFKFFLHCILLSLMLEIPLQHNWYLNIQLDRNCNSSHFRFSNVVLRNRKEKWQCIQNLDLNPLCLIAISQPFNSWICMIKRIVRVSQLLYFPQSHNLYVSLSLFLTIVKFELSWSWRSEQAGMVSSEITSRKKCPGILHGDMLSSLKPLAICTCVKWVQKDSHFTH